MALHDLEVIWAQKYRPRKIEDVILPKKIKSEMLGIVENGVVPNMIFAGTAGIGKTTVAMALCDELDYDYLLLNGSGEDRGIDAVKKKMMQYASTASMDGSRKCIIVDEADNMTHDAQLALRAIIESVSSNCSFILTCNFPNRINEAIHSRCPVVTFSLPKEESDELLVKMFKIAVKILEENEIQYEKEAVARLVKSYFPDFRKTIGALQRAANAGNIDSASLKDATASNMDALCKALKEQNIGAINSWVAESPSNPVEIISWFGSPARMNTVWRDEMSHVESAIISADYDRFNSVVSDQTNNLRAFLFKIMVTMKGKWK